VKLKLWHKIFVYSFVTVFLTQVLTLGWYLYIYDLNLRVKNVVRYLKGLSQNLQALNDADLQKYLETSQVLNQRVWLEDEAGRVVMGQPWPGMTRGERENAVSKRYDLDGTLALILKVPEPSLVVRVPIVRAGRLEYICYNWQRSPLVQYWGVFVQGILGLVGLSLILSLWTAKRVSRPLARLRQDVMKIAAGDLGLRLPEAGEDEVADVSAAVNHLTENLSQHVIGMRRLMANMSHEMRSSVASLSMSLEIIAEALDPSLSALAGQEAQTVAKSLSLARLEIDLLENMMASGLLGGKLDLKHEGLEAAPLDFSSLCRQAASRHALRASLKEIELESHVQNGLWLYGDEILLDRLLANVLDNALKYTEPGGKVAFKLKEDDGQLVVVCHNPHPPLSEEQLSNLCLPYYRAEEGRVYGSGLGLYLVKKIVLLHQGQIEIENRDQGVAFSIRLPLPREVDRPA
jgi:signal transduction histidine kinase